MVSTKDIWIQRCERREFHHQVIASSAVLIASWSDGLALYVQLNPGH